jgi:hypothetical protein
LNLIIKTIEFAFQLPPGPGYKARDRKAIYHFKALLTSLWVAADHDLRCDLPRRGVDGVYSSLLQHRLKHTESEWERVSFIRHTAGRENE